MAIFYDLVITNTHETPDKKTADAEDEREANEMIEEGIEEARKNGLSVR